jgi:hypothetical protein
MMLPRHKKGSIGLFASGTVGAVALAALVGWAVAPVALVAPPSPPGLEDTARAIWRNARIQSSLELSVVLLQLAGVGALVLSRMLPTTPWADRGRLAFVGAMLGLGVAGVLCAWYGSKFALFAGATMAILLNVVILGSTHVHQPVSAVRVRSPLGAPDVPLTA